MDMRLPSDGIRTFQICELYGKLREQKAYNTPSGLPLSCICPVSDSGKKWNPPRKSPSIRESTIRRQSWVIKWQLDVKYVPTACHVGERRRNSSTNIPLSKKHPESDSYMLIRSIRSLFARSILSSVPLFTSVMRPTVDPDRLRVRIYPHGKDKACSSF